MGKAPIREPSRFAAARDISFIFFPRPLSVTPSYYPNRCAGFPRDKNAWILRVRSAVGPLAEG